MFSRALVRRLQVTARSGALRCFHNSRQTRSQRRVIALVCILQCSFLTLSLSLLTIPQTSFAVVSGFSLWVVSPWSPIHADAPLPDHDRVLPGKTDERSLQGAGLIAMSEVAEHNRKEDCWVVIDGQVWDMTNVSIPQPSPLSRFLSRILCL